MLQLSILLTVLLVGTYQNVYTSKDR